MEKLSIRKPAGSIGMDFASALKMLSDAHAEEVRTLRQEIRRLRTSLGTVSNPVDLRKPSTSLELLETSGSANSLCKGCSWVKNADGFEESLPVEHHQGPAIPQLRCNGASTTPREAGNAPLIVHQRLSAIQRRSRQKPSTPVMPISPTRSITLPPTGDSDIEQRRYSAISISSEASSINFGHQSDDGCDITPLEQLWQQLVERLINGRSSDYIIRPDWTNFSKQASSAESEITRTQTVVSKYGIEKQSFRAEPSEQRTRAQLLQPTEAQRVALSRLEYKIRCQSSAADESSVPSRLSVGPDRVGFQRRMRISKGSNKMSCICHPASARRRFWVILCLFIIFYELFAITMEPFGLIGEGGRSVEWFSACFWVVDIVVNFFSGIYVEGKAEMRFYFIAKHYIRTWFFFDLIVAASQFISLVVQADGIAATFLLRIVRGVRSVRLGRVIYWLKDEFDISFLAITGGKLLQFLGALFLFVHCSACIWYEIGKSRNGWTLTYAGLTDSPGGNYLVSLHWALSQLQGNTDVYPGESILDRLFAVISSLSSIVALTFFVSLTTDTLFNARQQRKRKLDENHLMLSFFSRHDIDPDIRSRAEHHLVMKAKQQHALQDHEQDQAALQMFPQSMRSQLLSEIWSFCLVWHPLFSYLQKFHRNVFAKVCSTALELYVYEPNDDVFTFGEASQRAYFVLEGDFVLNVHFDLLGTVSPWLTARTHMNSSDDVSRKPRPTWRSTSSRRSGGRFSFQSRISEMTKRYSRFPHAARNSVEEEEWSRQSVVGADRISTMQPLPRTTLRSVRSHSTEFSTEKFMRPVRPILRLTSGSVVSEASLWLEWTHSGDLCSVEHGRCYSIDAAQLISTICQNPTAHIVFSYYAVRFLDAAKTVRQDKPEQLMETMSFLTVLDVEA